MDSTIFSRFRTSIAEPGSRTQHNRELVGQDSLKAFHIALLQNNQGEVIAFIADGKKPGIWFTGTVKGTLLQATGSHNERLSADVGKERIEGKAEVAGKNFAFTLHPALAGAGLRRIVRSVGGKDLDATFIIGNEGAIVGSADTQNRTAFTYHANAAEGSAEEPNISDDTGNAGSGNAVPMSFIQCSILVLRFHWHGNQGSAVGGSVDPATGTGDPFTSPEQQKIKAKFNANGCQEYYTL